MTLGTSINVGIWLFCLFIFHIYDLSFLKPKFFKWKNYVIPIFSDERFWLLVSTIEWTVYFEMISCQKIQPHQLHFIAIGGCEAMVRSDGRKERKMIWFLPSFLQWLQWWDNMILRWLIICSLFKEKFLVRYDAVTQQTGEVTSRSANVILSANFSFNGLIY